MEHKPVSVAPLLFDHLWMIVLFCGHLREYGFVLDEGDDVSYEENLRLVRERSDRLRTRIGQYFSDCIMVWPAEIRFRGAWPNWRVYAALRAVNRALGHGVLHLRVCQLHTPPKGMSWSQCRTVQTFHWRSESAKSFWNMWYYERRPARIVAIGWQDRSLERFPWDDSSSSDSSDRD